MSIKQITQQAEALFQKVFSCSYSKKAYAKLESFSKMLTKHGISANMITFAGLFFAVLGLNFLAISGYFFAKTLQHGEHVTWSTARVCLHQGIALRTVSVFCKVDQ